jgi:lipopolysaccharide/colanic/teichoic acid biosynthesis glycosyltransferase
MITSTTSGRRENETLRTGSNWMRVAYLNFAKEQKTVCILHIGTINDRQPSLLSKFDNTVFVADYLAAQEQLINAGIIDYDAIFIDLAFENFEFEKFIRFTRANIKLEKIPIIYNRERLQNNEAKFIRSFELVDAIIPFGIVNLDVNDVILEAKKNKLKPGRLTAIKVKLKVGNKERLRSLAFKLKTVIDVTVAACIILMLIPILLLIAIAIRLESKGPVFYSSPRAGKGYKIFKFYKFRSMVVDADKKIQQLAHLNQYDVGDNGPAFFKISNDPRVTRVGKFLRNTSLDELPQLFNVLKGDMSLVGNRPLPLYEAQTLTTNQFVERFTAPAGMTGLWQVKKRGKGEMSTEERMALDICYARKASPFFDLYLLLLTPMALFQKSDV